MQLNTHIMITSRFFPNHAYGMMREEGALQWMQLLTHVT